MTVKQFLYSVRDEQKEIEELTDRIYEMRMSLLPAGIRYDTDKVQTSPSDTISDRMAEITDYMKQMEEKKIELIRRRKQAQKMIDDLQDSRQRQVLDLYFLSVKRLSMEDVSAMIGYSRKQTFRIYKSALQNLIMTLNDTKKF